MQGYPRITYIIVNNSQDFSLPEYIRYWTYLNNLFWKKENGNNFKWLTCRFSKYNEYNQEFCFYFCRKWAYLCSIPLCYKLKGGRNWLSLKPSIENSKHPLIRLRRLLLYKVWGYNIVLVKLIHGRHYRVKKYSQLKWQ